MKKWLALAVSIVVLNIAIREDGWTQTIAIGVFVPTVAEYACQLVSERMRA